MVYSEGCPAGAVALSRGMQPIHSDLTGKEMGDKEPESLLVAHLHSHWPNPKSEDWEPFYAVSLGQQVPG